MEDVTSEVEYKIQEDVSKQDYELTFKICTISAGHEEHFLCVHVNDQNVQELSYPYTVGEWGFTEPVIVDIGEGDVCVLVSPSVRQDYQAAQKIASDGVAGAVVIVNGLAKVSVWKILP